MTLPIVERLRDEAGENPAILSPGTLNRTGRLVPHAMLTEAADTIEELMEALRKARTFLFADTATAKQIDALLAEIGGDA